MDLSNPQEQPLAAGTVLQVMFFHPLLKKLKFIWSKMSALQLISIPRTLNSTTTKMGAEGKREIAELK